MLTGGHLRYLNGIFGRARCDPGAVLAGRTGEHDHVRPLAGYPPQVSMAAPVNPLKGVSAGILRQR
jgi:REP element-mobilizing transposase RayT